MSETFYEIGQPEIPETDRKKFHSTAHHPLTIRLLKSYKGTILADLSRALLRLAMPDARLVDSKTTFASFANILDARLLRALADMGFSRPTLVQSKAIPIALENRDILARARTGSGKTAAYCIPVVQKVLSAKEVSLAFLGSCSILHFVGNERGMSGRAV